MHSIDTVAVNFVYQSSAFPGSPISPVVNRLLDVPVMFQTVTLTIRHVCRSILRAGLGAMPHAFPEFEPVDLCIL
jgi:hypothetical protein